MQTSKESSGVDKQGLFGWWHKSIKWQDDLHRRACHRALDMPEDDMNIRTGLGWKELAVIGAMVLGAGGLGIWGTSTPETPQPQPPATAPGDSEYDVRFFDADGKPIDLEPWRPVPGGE